MITDVRERNHTGWNPIYKRKIGLNEQIKNLVIKNLNILNEMAYKLEWSILFPRQNTNAWIFIEPNSVRNAFRILTDEMNGSPISAINTFNDNDALSIHGSTTSQPAGKLYPSSGFLIFTGSEDSDYKWNVIGEVQRDDGNKLRKQDIGAQISGTTANLTSLGIHAVNSGNVDVAFKGKIVLSVLDI